MQRINLELADDRDGCIRIIGDLTSLFSEYLIAYNRALHYIAKEDMSPSYDDIMRTQKIRIIRFMREQVGLGLLEAKVLVESFGDINAKLRATQMTAQIKFGC